MGVDEAEERASQHVADLRARLERDATAVMIFLGAGLSFGVGRRLGRGTFETPPPLHDDSRFPSWPLLIDRMKQELVASATDDEEANDIARFMDREEYLDGAQLYRLLVGEARYNEFLSTQFLTQPEDATRLTPSHKALTDLPVSELFTTNYDGLIELAYERWDGQLAVSSRPREFLEQQPTRPEHHLIKLHGTWDEPETIVLTRDDYARSRMERAEMFKHLAQETRFATFLFVGFSLKDPNFNLIRDEARMVMGENLPDSYLVQQWVSPLVRRYLENLGVKVVELFTWNELPAFLQRINPAR